jgi:nitroreductase
VTDAGDFFVMAIRTDIDENFVNEYVKNISETRGVSEESLKGFSDNMKGDLGSRDENNKLAWAGRQAYISLGFMLEAGAMLEVDMCPMEGFDAGKFDEILNLKSKNLKSVGAFAVGFRDESDIYANMKKVRVSKEDFVIQK